MATEPPDLPWPYGSRRSPAAIPEPPVDALTPGRDARIPFPGSAILALAVIAAAVQAGLAVVTAVRIFKAEVDLNNSPFRPLSNAFGGVLIRNGIAVLIAAALMIVCGILIWRRSSPARWTLAIWEAVMLMLTLLALSGPSWDFGFLTYLALTVGSLTGAPLAVILLLEAFVLYGLALHPATHRALAK